MVFLVFQSLGASAHAPNTGANEYNHAYYRNGGVATSSGSSGGLLLALKGEDIAPGLMGGIDEFLEVATLGFDLAQTGVVLSECVAGGAC